MMRSAIGRIRYQVKARELETKPQSQTNGAGDCGAAHKAIGALAVNLFGAYSHRVETLDIGGVVINDFLAVGIKQIDYLQE